MIVTSLIENQNSCLIADLEFQYGKGTGCFLLVRAPTIGKTNLNLYWVFAKGTTAKPQGTTG